MDIAITTYTLQHKTQQKPVVNRLIEGCVKQERRAQKQLYEQYQGKLMAVCMRYSNNYEDARDILHEGFVKIYKKIGTYKPTHSLDSWMKRIMINTAIDHYRKNKKHRNQVDVSTAYYLHDEDSDAALKNLSANEILALIQQLTPAYRAVFSLYVVEEYNHREIAEMLKISEGTSKSNLAKARARLRELIKKNYPDHYYLNR